MIAALFILRAASCLVVCALKVRLPTTTLDSCNDVDSQLPHRSFMISRSSCLTDIYCSVCLLCCQVAEGHEVMVLEAMKMQNSLVTGKSGKVR